MEANLLDKMLDMYLEGRTPVTVTLQNKIRISGKIKSFDSYVIVIEGQKEEIVYRHAVSSLAPLVPEEQKRQPAAVRPAPAKTMPPRPARTASHRPRPAHPQALSASAGEQSINNSMKEGLLRWMEEQKAAK